MARVRLLSLAQQGLFVLLLWSIEQCLANRIFTNGLSIINSPLPGNPGHAGSPLSISVDVSNDGKLPDAANTSCVTPTRYESLEIYLVSAQTEKNFTVASGSEFLDEENGSVRHCDWSIPKCAPAGEYNLTFYERSLIDGKPYFIITNVPLPIDNPSPDSTCTAGTNPYIRQLQDSSPPNPPYCRECPPSPTSTLTFTSGWVTSYTGGPQSTSLPPSTVTVTSVSVSVSVSTMLSLTTITSVQGNATQTLVQTVTSLQTATIISAPQGGLGGLIPINSGTYVQLSSIYLSITLSVLWFVLY